MVLQPKKESRGEEVFYQGFKLGEGRSRNPGSDPAAGEVYPKQGSGGKACQKTESSQIPEADGCGNSQ